MSGAGDQPPNYFAPVSVKGRGIRSLNRTPIIILGAVVLLVGGALAYTLYEKEASIRAKATEGSEASAGPATAAGVLANAPSSGVIPAGRLAPSPPKSAAAAPSSAEVPAPPASVPSPSPDQFAAQQRAAALAQEEAQVEQARLHAATAALTAGSAVALTPVVSTSLGSSPTGTTTPNGLPMLGENNAAGDTAARSGAGAGDPNGQGEKAAFYNQPPTVSDYLLTTREQPVSRFEIRAGTVIPAVMISGIDSDLPGQLLAQVTENVYGTATGQEVLIPQGAKLIGTYDNHVTYGQSRVLVAWNRIIYPDGSSLDIQGMPGADQSGYAGFNDEVDNHYLKVFGSAILMSLFSAGIQLSQPQPSVNSNAAYSNQQVMAGALGQQLGNAGMQMIQRSLDIAPTLEIRPGYLFNVMVTKDIVVKPWRSAASLLREINPPRPAPTHAAVVMPLNRDREPLPLAAAATSSANNRVGPAATGALMVRSLPLPPSTKPVTASSAAAVPPPPPPQPTWALTPGNLIGRELASWGQAAGWHVIWQVPVDWTVPEGSVFRGSFAVAAGQVVKDLAAQGAKVHGTFYRGNRTLVISDGGTQ